MELIVRGSEYQDFLNCRKKWYYGWVEKITPIKPDNKLFFGKLFHKWLEEYYNNECNRLSADIVTSVWLNEQDMSGMEQTEIDELKALFKGVSDYYVKTYGERDKEMKVLATELEFLVKLDEGVFMTGTIDLVYETPDGKIRFMDHKTVSSLQMYEDKALMDRQISRYWWALKMIALGVGRVKNAQGMWSTFPALEGKEIDGFDYNLIAKDFPKEPKILKNGSISQDKSQKTTYALYLQAISDKSLNPNDYREMLQMLQDKPNQWLRRVDVLRTPDELDSAAWEFMYTAGDLHDVKLMITENPAAIEAMTYRNIGNQCSTMCQFKSLCQTTISGGNVSLVKNLGYKKNEER